MENFTVNTHHAYLNHTIVIKTDGRITIKDTVTGYVYDVENELRTHLSAGHHVLMSDDHREVIFIEDAIKLGGSQFKSAFVFDNTPWCFVVTKDRLYIANLANGEEKVEYHVTPDEIISLPPHDHQKPNEHFLFKTHHDYSIYNVLTGKMVFQFTGHIFSNSHLAIFKDERGVVVYDFIRAETIVYVDGQYSFGENNFFFVRDQQLCGLNLCSSSINTISYVGMVRDSDMLLGNSLLRLNNDYLYRKVYSYFSLGNGENEDSMSETKIISPYYIASWKGEITPHFSRLKEDYAKFNAECNSILFASPYLQVMCLGIKISGAEESWNAGQYTLQMHGEMIAYPEMKFTAPFCVKGTRGETIDMMKYSIEMPKEQEIVNSSAVSNLSATLEDGERKMGVSESGNLMITQKEGGIYLIDRNKGVKQRILQESFDNSHYASAYFTSDGKNVLLHLSNKETELLGLDDLTIEPFEVDGFTLSRNEGYNGYHPEVSILKGGKPVWRDPITLDFIKEEDMSKHTFRSPDGSYIADTHMKTVIYNRLTKREVGFKEVEELESLYNWDWGSSEEERKSIIGRRRVLVAQSDRNDLFGKLFDVVNRWFSMDEDDVEEEQRCSRINEYIEHYITEERDFVSLMIDRLGYVYYHKNEEGAKEKRILIGRSVFFLNYVSFSYDSKYLSFAAKMNKDAFRNSQEGVFVIYDLEKEETINRIECFENHQLWAVWMTMFSKKGDVAFYDSCANAYLVRKSNNYVITEKAPGKSLLCFSPSGRYIACSDQNYIDYTHHPNGNWGHQPSGNVFIHSVDKFEECLEQYNDIGDGISGVATRAGSVSSAAFSQDETKLLMVGNDGVVVVRNLRMIRSDDDGCDVGYDDFKDDDGPHYGEYAGTYAQDVAGYSDDVINDAFDGEPDAYWNID